MRAAWYERQGPARDVLVVGDMDEPKPLAGEVRIRIAASGVNPGDVKKREDTFGLGMPYPRVIPHSDGSGTVDSVGSGVPPEWIGRRVWCYEIWQWLFFDRRVRYGPTVGEFLKGGWRSNKTALSGSCNGPNGRQTNPLIPVGEIGFKLRKEPEVFAGER